MGYISFKGRAERFFFSGLARVCPFGANSLTFLSVVFAFVSGFYIFSGFLAYAAVFFLFSVLLDGLDGEVARFRKTCSGFGSFLDKVADRIVDMTVLSAIVLAGLVPLFPGLVALCAVVLASYASAVAEGESGKKRLGEGLSLRPARSAVIFAGLLFSFVEPAVFAVLVLGFYGLLDRFRAAFALTRSA